MRYQADNKYRRYIPGYGFLSFARKFGNKYGKKCMDTAKNIYGKEIMDTAKKEGTNFAKIAGQNIIKKSAEATGDLIGNKIADKITSVGNKQPKNDENKEQEEIIIPPEKRQQLLMISDCFKIYSIKMEYQKIINLLGNNICTNVYKYMMNLEEHTMLIKKLNLSIHVEI